MAPAAKFKRSERGSALIESLSSVPALIAIVAAMLFLMYFAFARGWILYQAEQSLYCYAEGNPAFLCQRKAKKNLEEFLPFHRSISVRLSGGDQRWRSEIEWKLKGSPWDNQDRKIRIVRELSITGIINSGALQYSRRSRSSRSLWP